MGRSSTAGPSSGRRMLNGVLRAEEDEPPPPPPPAYLVNNDSDTADERAEKRYDTDMLRAALTAEILNQSHTPSAVQNWANDFGKKFGIDDLGGKAARIAHGIEHWTSRIAHATSDYVGQTFHISNDYFVNLAQKESGNRDWAHAGTSSASGAFQFVNGTWLGMVKQHGAEYGGELGWAANQIQRDGRGHFYVENENDLQKILDMRTKREYSAPMAQAFTNDNANAMAHIIGRNNFTQTDLYMAHFMGPRDGAHFLIEMQQNPNAIAAPNFTSAAGANHNVFYDRGRARTYGEVYSYLGRGFANDNTQVASASVTPTVNPDSNTVAVGDSIAKGLGLSGDAVVGRSPKQVLEAIVDRPRMYAGKDVVLSTGTSNGVQDIRLASNQIQALSAAGAHSIIVLGVGSRSDFSGVNVHLNEIVEQAHAKGINVRFAGPLEKMGPLSSDQVHPQSYAGVKDAVMRKFAEIAPHTQLARSDTHLHPGQSAHSTARA